MKMTRKELVKGVAANGHVKPKPVDSAAIRADVEEFLAKGNKITEVEQGVSGMRQIRLKMRGMRLGYAEEYDRKSFNAGDRSNR